MDGRVKPVRLSAPVDLEAWFRVANVMLLGLSGETNDRLTRVLEAHHHTVVPEAENAGLTAADAIFCGGDNLSADQMRKVVESHAAVPVIVVTRNLAAETVLDAMDRGAVDYCSEPLEESEVLWALATVLESFEHR